MHQLISYRSVKFSVCLSVPFKKYSTVSRRTPEMILWARMDAAGDVIGEDRKQRRKVQMSIGPRGIPPVGQPQIDGAMTIQQRPPVMSLNYRYKSCRRWPHV